MNIPILLIGSAFDGAVASPIAPLSVEDAYETFGAYVYEDHVVSATATGITATNEVHGGVEFYTWVDEELKPFPYICNVSTSGTAISFERIGTDQSLVIRYARPMPSGSPLVYKGYNEVFTTTDVIPHLFRVGGTPASAQITSGGVGLEFTTTGAGALYNGASISVTTTGFTLTQPPGKGMPYVFTTTDKTVDELAGEVNLRYMRGYGCVICESIGSGSFLVTGGTYPLSGGADGDFTDQDLTDLFSNVDFSGICTVSILGKNFPVSGDTGILGDLLTSDYLDDLPNPMMFVQNVNYVSGMAENDYITLLEDNKPVTHKNVMLVVGQGYFNDDIHVPYLDGLSTAIAPLIPFTRNSMFWQTTGVPSIIPSFTQEGIARLKAAGYTVLGTHYTKNEPIVVSDTSSDPEWDSRKYLAVMDTVATIRPYLETLLGTRPMEAEKIRQDILVLLGSLNLQEYNADVTLYRNGLVYVELMIRPNACIETISFTVSVNT